MRKIKRMRVFGGPNGSGKSTTFNNIKRLLHIGYFVNADEIETQLNNFGFINLFDFGINTNKATWVEFKETSSLPKKAKASGLNIQLEFKNNIIIQKAKASFSYESAMIAEFIRLEFIKSDQSFSYETVMSHPSKIELFDISARNGFRNYLYFICTESPIINIERVKVRVKKGGHPVPEEKIESRYFRSLGLLHEAAMKTYRTFVFDNSGNEQRLILELHKGRKITRHSDWMPVWVKRHLLDKIQ